MGSGGVHIVFSADSVGHHNLYALYPLKWVEYDKTYMNISLVQA